MSEEFKNVHRIYETNEGNLGTSLSPKMIGLEGTYYQLGAKFPSGDMKWYTPKGGQAEYDTLKVTSFPLAGNVKALADGSLYVDDAPVSEFDYVDFIPQDPAPDHLEGRLFYDAGESTLQFYNNNENFLNYVNEAQMFKAINTTGSLITAGTVVDIHGALMEPSDAS